MNALSTLTAVYLNASSSLARPPGHASRLASMKQYFFSVAPSANPHSQDNERSSPAPYAYGQARTYPLWPLGTCAHGSKRRCAPIPLR